MYREGCFNVDVTVHTIVRSLISNVFMACNNKNNNSFKFFTIISVETIVLLIRLFRLQRKRVTTSFQDTSMILLTLENCTVFNITNARFLDFEPVTVARPNGRGRGEAVKRSSQYRRQNKSRPLTARRFRAQRFRQLEISSSEKIPSSSHTFRRQSFPFLAGSGRARFALKKKHKHGVYSFRTGDVCRILSQNDKPTKTNARRSRISECLPVVVTYKCRFIIIIFLRAFGSPSFSLCRL